MKSLTVPHELTAPEREAIVAHLHKLEDAHAWEEARSFEFSLPGRPPLFIKQSDDILVEASTQQFFYLRAIGEESAPRIPKVFDAFYCEEGYRVMVMEKIDAPTLSDSGISEEEAVEHAASAVKWLIDQLPWIPDASFGRISSKPAPVRHMFFKDNKAPRVFANSKELSEYVSKASRRCRGSTEQPFSTGLEELLTSLGESRCIYHSDINERNFLLIRDSKRDSTTPDRVCIIDFEHIGLFPPAFQSFAFFNIGKGFAARVGRRLGYQPLSTANVMVRISNVLQQTGGNANLK